MRPGHHRPIGSTTTLRFEWSGERIPDLGDVAFWESGPDADDWKLARRAYLVVGFLEGRVRSRFKIVAERLDFDVALGAVADGAPYWCFYNLPRRR